MRIRLREKADETRTLDNFAVLVFGDGSRWLLRREGVDILSQRMTESAKQKILEAAVVVDWMQVVLNQGPPCFHLEEYGSFCLRSERWDGHGIEDFHDFVSLHDLLRILIIPVNNNPTSPASSPEPTQQKWRVGGKVPLNVYKGDRPIFQAHSIEDARHLSIAITVTVLRGCFKWWPRHGRSRGRWRRR